MKKNLTYYSIILNLIFFNSNLSAETLSDIRNELNSLSNEISRLESSPITNPVVPLVGGGFGLVVNSNPGSSIVTYKPLSVLGGVSYQSKLQTGRIIGKGNLKDIVGLKPEDIPKQPFKVYNEWVSWPDWLGTQSHSKSIRILDYAEARKFVLSLKLYEKQIIRIENGRKNDARNKWNDYCLGLYENLPNKPPNIPVSIHYYYKGIGYEGYRHFITPDDLL